MPRVAQTLEAKIRMWIAPYNKEFRVVSTDRGVVYCDFCSKQVGSERKLQIDIHTQSGIHVKAVARKKKQKKDQQTFLATDTKNPFHMDLCCTLVASDILLNKLNYDPFIQFLLKYTHKQVPSESFLQKNCPIIYEQSMDKIPRP